MCDIGPRNLRYVLLMTLFTFCANILHVWMYCFNVVFLNAFRVLVFPPVANFRRFLIHKLVEESFPSLKTFSVGEADARRTVICFQTDYLQESTVKATPKPEVRLPSKSPRTMPSVGIYRPPAARKLDQNATEVSCRSPPPTRRKLCENSVKPAKSPPSMPANAQVEINPCEKRGRQRRPDMAVYVPRGQRIAQEHQRKLEAMSIGNDEVELQLGPSPFEDHDTSDSDKLHRLSIMISDESPQVAIDDSPKKDENNVNLDNKSKKYQDDHEGDSDSSGTSSISIEFIEFNAKELDPEIDIVNEIKDTPISLPAFVVSSVQNLEVQECEKLDITVSENTKPDITAADYNTKISIHTKKEVKSTKSQEDKLNPDELDWDVLYDDSGECLNPTMLGQLTSAVGQVSIETPKSSYDDYKHKNLEDEFPHVVEVYNFPPEFKTPDLVMVFSDFKNSGFEIKWVDDTHALGVFSNAAIVSEVLCMQHPFVKTRCLSEGSQQSKSKARRCADSLTPYMARPDTCAALARRLVTGALGVKLPTQRAEREAERKLLREAREKKKLAAKQRDEAWEGTFS